MIFILYNNLLIFDDAYYFQGHALQSLEIQIIALSPFLGFSHDQLKTSGTLSHNILSTFIQDAVSIDGPSPLCFNMRYLRV